MHAATPRTHFRLPLHIHISTLFFLLVLAAGGSIAWVSYARSVTMLERAAEDLVERISAQTLSETERLLQPVAAAVQLAALQHLVEATTFERRRDSLPFLRRVLASSEAASSIYAGYANGDFFLLFRIVDDEARRAIDAPPGAAWMVQSIEGGKARFIHLDTDLHVLRDDPRPDFAASYDPRRRTWFREAVAADVPIYTAPYVFATTGKTGITVARRSEDGRAVVGRTSASHPLGTRWSASASRRGRNWCCSTRPIGWWLPASPAGCGLRRRRARRSRCRWRKWAVRWPNWPGVSRCRSGRCRRLRRWPRLRSMAATGTVR